MYITDGIHLYEVLQRVTNYGLLGGEYLVVQDCKDDKVRAIDLLEQTLCTPIHGS